MFCLQGEYSCFYNLDQSCFVYPCSSNFYAWPLTQNSVPRFDAPNGERAVDLRLGACIFPGGNHDKVGAVCVRVFLGAKAQCEQTFDWGNMEGIRPNSPRSRSVLC